MESPLKYRSNIAFIDLLFNLIVGITFLFIIAFILIKPDSKKEDFKRKGEFIITMEWPVEYLDDIDLWVENPNEELVWYSKKDSGGMFLDRDDLGRRNDYYIINGARKVIKINREVVTIRGVIPGNYTINSHFYSGNKRKIPITVEVEKVNPYSTIFKETKIIPRKGSEISFITINIDKNKKVKFMKKLDKMFIKAFKRKRTATSPSPNLGNILGN